jgi:hypothetical protein
MKNKFIKFLILLYSANYIYGSLYNKSEEFSFFQSNSFVELEFNDNLNIL